MGPASLLAVTLNPAVDRNYQIPGIGLDGVFRAQSVRVTAGGKGVNAARVWRTLGGRAAATGFAGGPAGEMLRRMIAAEGIADEFVRIADETRTSIAVSDSAAQHDFVINEIGPAATSDEQSAFADRFESLVSGFDWVAICGSAAGGVPAHLYAELIDIAHRGGARVLLDASGENLRAGAGAGPDVVKPNAFEAAALGARIDRWSDAPGAALRLSNEFSVGAVLISGGAAGAVVCADGQLWSGRGPELTAASTLGCGDSMAAGVMWALSKGQDWGQALRLGIAAGAANALTPGAGWMSMGDIQAQWGRIQANKLA